MTDNTNTPNKGIKEIWGTILPDLINEIQNAENNSYSINLLEEVKMANKDVRRNNDGTDEKSSLDVNVNENANSRILAKLFQYKSPDGKYEILQSLLDYIRNRDENAVLNFGDIKIDNDNTIITTEETLGKDKDRIDILVRTGKYAIIFENKLFNAPDQENQLARYIEKVETVKKPNSDSEYEDDNIFVIYLSSYGDEPADNSWVKTNTTDSLKSSFKDRYANLSFKDDILPWLKDYVLPNVRKKDTDLESALVQYINYLDRMFMKNNDDLTKWLEKELEKGERESNEPDHMVKIHRLEKVEELIATLKKDQPSRSKISVEKLKDFINSETNEDLTNEDLLNKTIAVIENLRDNCRDKVLEPFYRVSKSYFDIIHVSSPSAAYCWLLKNKKWEGEIRFIWLPFFFNVKNEYKLTLEIILTDNNANENGNRIKKFETVQDAINNQINVLNSLTNKVKNINGVKNISFKNEFEKNNNNSIDVNKEKKQVSPRVQKLLQITLKTNEKLLYFAPKDQEDLFRAIYESLSGVIEAIDKCFENLA